MAIDTRINLEINAGQKILPVTGVSKTNKDCDPNFNETLQKCLKEREQNKPKGADVLHKIEYGYCHLYNKYGVQPNAVMITQDYLAAVITECSGYCVVQNCPDQLLGLDVIPIIGKEIVKVCIIDKEGDKK